MTPYLSAKRLPKIRTAAVGATTNGSSTLIRQNVRPRSWVSSSAAMATAMITWGTDDIRKMLNVLTSDFWNTGSVSTNR